MTKMAAEDIQRLSVLLTLLRPLGVLPYTPSAAPSTLQLNVKWLLWSIFLLTSVICSAYLNFIEAISLYHGDGFSDLVVVYLLLMMQIMAIAMQFSIVLKSKTLVRIYQSLSENGTFDQIPHRISFFDCLTIMISILSMFYNAIHFNNFPIPFIEKTVLVLYSWDIYFVFTIYLLTFKHLYSALSQKLFEEVQQAITESMHHLDIRASMTTETHYEDRTLTVPPLNHLEREICMVSNIGEDML